MAPPSAGLIAIVGARLRAMLLISCSAHRTYGTRAFDCLRQPSYFLFAWPKRKITKEKGHPASAPCGHPVRKVRGRATGFVDSTSCADAKLAGIHAGHPAGFPSLARRCRGAPGRVADHPGPHSSKEPDQERSCSKPELCSGFCFPALSPSAGQDGPLLYRGPCAAVRWGRQAAQRALPGMATPFRAGRMPARKARPRLTDLPGTMPGKRQVGCRFLLVTSLLDKQKRSNSPSEGGRKLFALMPR